MNMDQLCPCCMTMKRQLSNAHHLCWPITINRAEGEILSPGENLFGKSGVAIVGDDGLMAFAIS